MDPMEVQSAKASQNSSIINVQDHLAQESPCLSNQILQQFHCNSDSQSISSNQSEIIEENTQFVCLAHNQLQIVMRFLNFNDILRARGVSKQLGKQIKLYLSRYYFPKYFNEYNIQEEQMMIAQLTKRQSKPNFSEILNENLLISLEKMQKNQEQMGVVAPLINCYNILSCTLVDENFDKRNVNCQKQNNLNYENLSVLRNNLSPEKLTSEQYQLLSEELQNIQLPIITPQLRQIAQIARGFSQLVISYNLRNTLNLSKKKLAEYHILSLIINNAPLPLSN